MLLVVVHSKKRCSRDSICELQKRHLGSNCGTQSLSCVPNLFLQASHKIKGIFGIAEGNHTNLCQVILGLICRKQLYADVIENSPKVEGFQNKPSGEPDLGLMVGGMESFSQM